MLLILHFISDLFCSVPQVLRSESYSRGKIVSSWLIDFLMSIHSSLQPSFTVLLSVSYADKQMQVHTCKPCESQLKVTQTILKNGCTKTHTHTDTPIRFAFLIKGRPASLPFPRFVLLRGLHLWLRAICSLCRDIRWLNITILEDEDRRRKRHKRERNAVVVSPAPEENTECARCIWPAIDILSSVHWVKNLP